MDDLASAAGVARRTLYNQLASKEEIFREMLLRYRVQGVVRSVAGATQKGVEVTLGTGWQRRRRYHNLL